MIIGPRIKWQEFPNPNGGPTYPAQYTGLQLILQQAQASAAQQQPHSPQTPPHSGHDSGSPNPSPGSNPPRGNH
jgi:hypothetical protein